MQVLIYINYYVFIHNIKIFKQISYYNISWVKLGLSHQLSNSYENTYLLWLGLSNKEIKRTTIR